MKIYSPPVHLMISYVPSLLYHVCSSSINFAQIGQTCIQLSTFFRCTRCNDNKVSLLHFLYLLPSFAAGFEKFSHPGSRSKISNVMITELFYSRILAFDMSGNSLRTSSRRIQHSDFEYRLTKNGFAGPKSSWGFPVPALILGDQGRRS